MIDTALADAKASKTCPSAPPEPGSALFGVVAAKGQVAYITPNVPVTNELLVILGQSGIPIENRLRFSGACMEHLCVQWEGGSGSGRCGLIDQAMNVFRIESAPLTCPNAVSGSPAVGSPSTAGRPAQPALK